MSTMGYGIPEFVYSNLSYVQYISDQRDTTSTLKLSSESGIELR